MREIKFRGKPCYMGGETTPWVYGTFRYLWQRRVTPGATDNGRIERRVDKGCIVGNIDIETEVLYDTVGQYTGLKDKNGREIYEGDIVRWENRNTYPNVGVVKYWENQCKFACEAEYGAFELVECYAAGEHLSEYVYNTYEVIGNIHDNPELLKQ